ncbi:MAG: response regulator transcription factor [Terriglobia bacterium]
MNPGKASKLNVATQIIPTVASNGRLRRGADLRHRWASSRESQLEARGVAFQGDGQRDGKLNSKRIPFLTNRQIGIVQRIVSGYSVRDIAQDLGVGQQAIKHDLSNIFDKLGVSSRLELALYAVHHQMAG